MKNKNRFHSYGDALKKLELLKGQELNEATKYVLKQNKPEDQSVLPTEDMGTETPMPDETSAPDAGMGGDTAPSTDGGMGDENAPLGTDEMGIGEPKPSDYMTEIQKFAGKLGQELRDQKMKMESDDYKYVLNMIISACDLEKIDEDDLDDIASKFNRNEEGTEDEYSAEEPVPNEEPVPEPIEELGEMMKGLDEFINMPNIQDEEDMSNYAMDRKPGQEEDREVQIDLEEIKTEINKRVGETLSKYFK